MKDIFNERPLFNDCWKVNSKGDPVCILPSIGVVGVVRRCNSIEYSASFFGEEIEERLFPNKGDAVRWIERRVRWVYF